MLKAFFPNAACVMGYDQDMASIKLAKQRDPLGIYISQLASPHLESLFDVIFCMSVLCIHPITKVRQPLRLETFNKNIEVIATHLKPNDGLFVLFNSQYPLLATKEGQRFFEPLRYATSPCRRRYCEAPFVMVLDPNNTEHILRSPYKDDMSLSCPLENVVFRRRRWCGGAASTQDSNLDRRNLTSDFEPLNCEAEPKNTATTSLVVPEEVVEVVEEAQSSAMEAPSSLFLSTEEARLHEA